MNKKLSIAFIWHMHQPMYKLDENSDYLMPWVRLHAVKDYLDMLLIMQKFPSLKLNFNLVPLLLSMLLDYQNENVHDIHSRLTVKDVNLLTDEEKEFIFNNFFDANYNSMISHHEPYKQLYEKRYLTPDIGINDFSLQEYSDIMMWFNLAWMDPVWKNEYPQLLDFLNKERNYTHQDRIDLISIQRDIIKRIIPSYKRFQDEGKIEISTSPYYHPILPVLLDVNDANNPLNTYSLPDSKFDFADDAMAQVSLALDMCENLFGIRPKGIWPSEHCISNKTIDLLNRCGVKWAISDEGVLANSLKVEFIRDFRGNLSIPYDICNVYSYKNVDLVFRDAVIPNIIGFEYPRHNQKQAANDLYDRIKIIQNKLLSSPDSSHILTIAMDGENCWENFTHDGEDFLETLYSLIENDDSLETVTVSEYLSKNSTRKKLKNIIPGSWINRNFSLWIAEPTKNLAWVNLCHAKRDFKIYEKKYKNNPELIKKAQNELYIAQSSDWFWWYGEPNDSGHDYVFDLLFRTHIKNMYKIFNEPVPDDLEVSLSSFVGKPSRYPKSNISPIIDGVDNESDNWANAGCIELPSGPVLSENKFFNKIFFGNDDNNIYFRFDVNSIAFNNAATNSKFHTLSIFFKTQNAEHSSHVRVAMSSETVFPNSKELYDYEIRFPFYKDERLPYLVSRACADGMWIIIPNSHISIRMKNIIEISVPFDDLKVKNGERVDFIIITAINDTIEEVVPQDTMLSVYRNM